MCDDAPLRVRRGAAGGCSPATGAALAALHCGHVRLRDFHVRRRRGSRLQHAEHSEWPHCSVESGSRRSRLQTTHRAGGGAGDAIRTAGRQSRRGGGPRREAGRGGGANEGAAHADRSVPARTRVSQHALPLVWGCNAARGRAGAAKRALAKKFRAGPGQARPGPPCAVTLRFHRVLPFIRRARRAPRPCSFEL